MSSSQPQYPWPWPAPHRAVQASSHGAVQAASRDAAGAVQAASRDAASIARATSQGTHELVICSWNLGVPDPDGPGSCLNSKREEADFSDWLATHIQDLVVSCNVDVLLVQESNEVWARQIQTAFSLSSESRVQLHWCEKNAILAKDFWRG